jgi:endonuclease/exonuclease/phosphatase family metal-dependent hydrolase
VSKLNQLMADRGPDGAYDKLVVVLGDLNSPASEDGYQVLTGHRYVNTRLAYTPTQLPIAQSTPITFLDSRHTLFRRTSTDIISSTPFSNSLVLGAPFGENSTYTGFSTGSRPTLIDYILLANNGVIQRDECDSAPWRVAKYGVIPNHFGDGIWVSDHRMVVVTLRRS